MRPNGISIFAFLGCLCTLLGLCILLSGCDPDTKEPSLDSLAQNVGKILGAAKDGAEQLAPHGKKLTDNTLDEVEKLSALEYKVKDLDASSSARQIQAELELLGKDRWDCYQISHLQDVTRLYCKRMPKSYLRYLLPALL